jgi:uncharacterized protein YndB with AHSA1/START domain
MVQAIRESGQLMARDRSDDLITRVGEESDVEIQLEATISGEIRINTAPATIFALLTNAQQMVTWLARDVNADPRPGGIFRLADFSGLWVEGAYLEVIPHKLVVFSWGGIEGLKRGQSTVEFTLQRDGNSTLVRLRHFGLSDWWADAHRLCWKNWGLPKLRAVAEGREPGLTCLSEVADSREPHPYLARVACQN